MFNPYAVIGGLVGIILLVTGAFFYGQHVGYDSRKAEETDTLAKQFQGYVTAAGDAAKNGTAAALADFRERIAVLDKVANDLQITKGIMNNAAARLSSSLRGGACVFNPDQRRLLECIRRPGDAACTAPSL